MTNVVPLKPCVRHGMPLLAFLFFVLLGWGVVERLDAEIRKMENVRTGEVATTFALSWKRSSSGHYPLLEPGQSWCIRAKARSLTY